MEKEFNSCGVKVISIGADSAGPFTKAMINESCLSQKSKANHCANLSDDGIFHVHPKNIFSAQDIIHILAKLQTKLITPST